MIPAALVWTADLPTLTSFELLKTLTRIRVTAIPGIENPLPLVYATLRFLFPVRPSGREDRSMEELSLEYDPWLRAGVLIWLLLFTPVAGYYCREAFCELGGLFCNPRIHACRFYTLLSAIRQHETPRMRAKLR